MGIRVSSKMNNELVDLQYTYNEILRMGGIFRPVDDHYSKYRFFSIPSFATQGRMLIQVADDGTVNAVHGHHNWDRELYILVDETLTIEVK